MVITDNHSTHSTWERRAREPLHCKVQETKASQSYRKETQISNVTNYIILYLITLSSPEHKHSEHLLLWHSSLVLLVINTKSMLLLRFYCNAYDFCCRIGWVAVWRVKTFMLLSKWTFGPQPICLILCLDFLKFTISYWVITLDKVYDKSEGVVTVSKGSPATFWFPLPLV